MPSKSQCPKLPDCSPYTIQAAAFPSSLCKQNTTQMEELQNFQVSGHKSWMFHSTKSQISTAMGKEQGGQPAGVFLLPTSSSWGNWIVPMATNLGSPNQAQAASAMQPKAPHALVSPTRGSKRETSSPQTKP